MQHGDTGVYGSCLLLYNLFFSSLIFLQWNARALLRCFLTLLCPRWKALHQRGKGLCLFSFLTDGGLPAGADRALLFILVIFVSFCIAPREFSGMEEPDGTGRGEMISDDGSLAPPYPPWKLSHSACRTRQGNGRAAAREQDTGDKGKWKAREGKGMLSLCIDRVERGKCDRPPGRETAKGKGKKIQDEAALPLCILCAKRAKRADIVRPHKRFDKLKSGKK